MPTFKSVGLILRDLGFFLAGSADLAAENSKAGPDLYPIDFSYQLARLPTYFSPLDHDGIPLCPIRGLGNRYLFSRIAAYGLVHWNEARKRGNDPAYLRTFLRTAQWVHDRVDNGRYPHDFALAGMSAGWISCISQGELASLLVRAYWHTGERRYLLAAERAVGPLCIPMADGGLLSALPDGSPFFEEYPNSRINLVLNGCLYALVGLLDVTRAAREAGRPSSLEPYAEAVLKSLEKNISHWDEAGWSTYDYKQPGERIHNLNTMTYHVLQTTFLRRIAEQCRSEPLAIVAERWSRSGKSLRRRLAAFAQKVQYRLKKGYV